MDTDDDSAPSDCCLSDLDLGCLQLVLARETHAIIGAAMEVLNLLGHGLLEKPYENSLVVELGRRGITCCQQPRFKVMYKGVAVGEYVPDLTAFGSVVIETKTIDRIGAQEVGQVLNYLKITGYKVGLILNFKRSRLEWKRVVNTERLGGSLTSDRSRRS